MNIKLKAIFTYYICQVETSYAWIIEATIGEHIAAIDEVHIIAKMYKKTSIYR